MFEAICAGNRDALLPLAFEFLKGQNIVAGLLCLDHHFSKDMITGMAHLEGKQLSDKLDAFICYIQLLSKVAFHHNHALIPDVHLLFNIRDLSDNLRLIPTTSPLSDHILCSSSVRSKKSEEGLMISSVDLARVLKTILTIHLKAKINEQEHVARETRAFVICINYSVVKTCPRAPCPNLHLSKPLTVEVFNLHVRIQLQQIIICQALASLDFASAENRRK